MGLRLEALSWACCNAFICCCTALTCCWKTCCWGATGGWLGISCKHDINIVRYHNTQRGITSHNTQQQLIIHSNITGGHTQRHQKKQMFTLYTSVFIQSSAYKSTRCHVLYFLARRTSYFSFLQTSNYLYSACIPLKRHVSIECSLH